MGVPRAKEASNDFVNTSSSIPLKSKGSPGVKRDFLGHSRAGNRTNIVGTQDRVSAFPVFYFTSEVPGF